MIHTAKAIAANGQAIVHFANHIGEQCTDKRYVTIIMMVRYEKAKCQTQSFLQAWAAWYVCTSFIPWPLPDFILQPWRKIGRSFSRFFWVDEFLEEVSPDFSPWLRDKIWEWPGDESTMAVECGTKAFSTTCAVQLCEARRPVFNPKWPLTFNLLYFMPYQSLILYCHKFTIDILTLQD